jgi:hypothetical protein
MELFAKLPLDLRLRILPYTYTFQSKHLLRDIESYKETKDALLRVYHSYWNSEDRDWLINDMIAYANHYKPTMNGYTYQYYSIFRRNTQLQTMDSIHKYVNRLEEKDVKTQINIVLGLFTVYERTDLVIDLSTTLENLDE